MSSESYRYYCLDRAGHLRSGEWFEADNDEDAVGQIEVKHPDGMSEIWHGKRFVAKIDPKRLQRFRIAS